jgi:hypothetical protein
MHLFQFLHHCVGKSQFCRLAELKKVPPTHFGTCQKKCRLDMLSKKTAAMYTKKTAAAERCVINAVVQLA